MWSDKTAEYLIITWQPCSEDAVAYWYYRKIPKITPGAYIFQRPFLRGLFLEGLFPEFYGISWKTIELTTTVTVIYVPHNEGMNQTPWWIHRQVFYPELSYIDLYR